MNLTHADQKYIDPFKIRLIPIPDISRHDVIYSTLVAMDGRVSFGVSSEFHPEGYARLMTYDPRTDQLELIIDLADQLPYGRETNRPPHSKIHTTLCKVHRGVVEFAH